MADKKNYSKDDVLKAWEGDDKQGQFEIREVKTKDGESDQTHIYEKTNGSLIVAVDGTGKDALQKLAENPRDPFIDGGLPPQDAIEGEVQRTEEGVLRTPTQPEALKTAEGLGELDPDTLKADADKKGR